MIEDPIFLNKLTEWSNTAAHAKAFSDREMELRKELFGQAFPAAVEGVNKVDLPLGWLLKATHKISRNLDEAALPAVAEEISKLGVNPDTLVKRKPELITSAYKALTEQARLVFDQALIIKAGSPSLELVAPKEPKS